MTIKRCISSTAHHLLSSQSKICYNGVVVFEMAYFMSWQCNGRPLHDPYPFMKHIFSSQNDHGKSLLKKVGVYNNAKSMGSATVNWVHHGPKHSPYNPTLTI